MVAMLLCGGIAWAFVFIYMLASRYLSANTWLFYTWFLQAVEMLSVRPLKLFFQCYEI
jgi:hypothetical protein